MSKKTTSFSDIDKVIADVKIWQKDLKDTPDDKVDVKSQLLYNVAPFFESMARAVGVELSEQAEIQADLANTIGELIDQEGSFLQPELAVDLSVTLQVGMAIVGILESEGVKLDNDLKQRQLQEAIKHYKTNTTILMEEIEAITKPDDEDEEDDENDSIIHGESRSGEESDQGGEGTHGDGGDLGNYDPDTNTDSGSPDAAPEGEESEE